MNRRRRRRRTRRTTRSNLATAVVAALSQPLSTRACHHMELLYS
jgi:uncharacterized membrane protein